MTKKFDVVSLDGFIYLVDKESKEKGKWEIIEGQLNLLSDDVDREGFLVIASNNPSIDVPQIKLPEEDDGVQLSMKAIEGQKFAGGEHEKQVAGIFYRRGYKAAKAKKYDEKDMRKLMDWAWSWFRSKDESKFQEFLKSLTKPIKSITIEMEEEEIEIYPDDGYPIYKLIPKLDKEGFVIIKEVEYHE